MAEVIRIRPQAATVVRQSNPRREYAGRARDALRVQDGEARTLLQFVIDLPRDFQHVSSELILRAEQEYGGTKSVTVRRTDPVTRAFNEVNWANQPAVAAGSTPHPVEQPGSKRGWTFNTTDDTATDKRVVFQVSTTSNEAMFFRGTRDSKGYPVLAVTVERIPAKPHDLAPDGVVGVAKPYLTWAARPGFNAIQVQIATDETFTTIVHDTGTVDETKPEYDLARAVSWAGLVSGEAALAWRVRGRYSSGGWSEYSDAADLARVDKGVPVITNPTGGVSADPSPPIVWIPPADQASWQVLVDLDYRGESWDTQANSEERTGSDDAWTPEMGGDDPGTRYRARVRTFGSLPRSQSPGDPTYGEDTVEWVWEPSAEVPGLTAGSITQMNGLPAASVWWSRDIEVPDQVGLLFSTPGLTRKILLDGTAPRVPVWELPPNRDLRVRMAAVVNGAWSADQRIERIRLAVEGMWLVDPGTGRGVVLAGRDGISLAYGAQISTYTPHRAAALVNRTTALRGIEGTISGHLDDWPGRTRDEQLEDLAWLRSKPARELRLVGGDINIPVTVTNPAPMFDSERFIHDAPEHDQVVSFGVGQVDREIPGF